MSRPNHDAESRVGIAPKSTQNLHAKIPNTRKTRTSAMTAMAPVEEADRSATTATVVDPLNDHNNRNNSNNSSISNDDYGALSAEQTQISELDIEEAIERLGIGPYQWVMAFIAGLCLSCDGIEILLLSFLTVVLRAQWNLTASEGAAITSCIFAGSFLGTILQGPLGDSYGRRPVFLSASSLIAGFGLATAFAQNLTQLIVLRFFVGVGLGGCFIPFDAVSEVLPVEQRGKVLMYVQFLWAFGTASVPVFAYWTLPQGNWRLFVVVCATPCVVATLLGVWLVPESPRWLIDQNKANEALRILRKAAKWNGKDPDTIFPEGTRLVLTRAADIELPLNDKDGDIVGVGTTTNGEFQNCATLFCTTEWLGTTLKLCINGFGEGFLYYAGVLVITRVFSTSTSHGTGYQFNFAAIFTSSTAELVGTFVVIAAVDTVGRIQTQAWSWIVDGIAMASLCMIAETNHLQNETGDSTTYLLVALAYVVRICGMTGSSALWISTAEIMTTSVRTTGHSVVYATGRIGGFLCPLVVKTTVPLSIVALVVSLFGFGTAVSVWSLPETTGKALGKVVIDAATN